MNGDHFHYLGRHLFSDIEQCITRHRRLTKGFSSKILEGCHDRQDVNNERTGHIEDDLAQWKWGEQ